MKATIEKPSVAPAAGQEAPGPPGIPLLGNLPTMRRQGTLQMLVDGWRRYGDVVRFQLGPMTQFLLGHPDHAKYVLLTHKDNFGKGVAFAKMRAQLGNGLVTSEGDLWRRQRRLMQPPFTARAVTHFAGMMTEASTAVVARWQGPARRGDVLNLNDEMMRFAIGVIGQAMFSVDLGGEAQELGRAFEVMMHYMADHGATLIDIPASIPTPENRRYNAAMHMLNSYVYNLIDSRRNQPDAPLDLMSMLLRARDEETGQGMSAQQLRDEVLTILFAGHDTTAHVLAWTWYLLAEHPAVEAQLHAELAAVLGGRLPTVEDLPRLPYNRMVLEEAMRLYPPAWAIPRQAIEDDEVDGYRIPAGSLIMVSPFITHRHPAFWADPDRFDPERFRPGQTADRPAYAYFPFGGGPRICIGNHFALLEAQLFLATVAQQYRIRLVPGQTVEPSGRGTLRPERDILVTLQVREGTG